VRIDFEHRKSIKKFCQYDPRAFTMTIEINQSEECDIHIALLNGSVVQYSINRFTRGWKLWRDLVNDINLTEENFFSLEFLHPETKYAWLDMHQPVLSQLYDTKLQLSVKFFPNSIDELTHPYTKQLFCLFIQEHLTQKSFECPDALDALLFAYILHQYDCTTVPIEQIQKYMQAVKTDLPWSFIQDVYTTLRDILSLTSAQAEDFFINEALKFNDISSRPHPCWIKDQSNVIFGSVVCNQQGISVLDGMFVHQTFPWSNINQISVVRDFMKIRLNDSIEAYKIKFSNRSTAKAFQKLASDYYKFSQNRTPQMVEKPSWQEIFSCSPLIEKNCVRKMGVVFEHTVHMADDNLLIIPNRLTYNEKNFKRNHTRVKENSMAKNSCFSVCWNGSGSEYDLTLNEKKTVVEINGSQNVLTIKSNCENAFEDCQTLEESILDIESECSRQPKQLVNVDTMSVTKSMPVLQSVEHMEDDHTSLRSLAQANDSSINQETNESPLRIDELHKQSMILIVALLLILLLIVLIHG